MTGGRGQWREAAAFAIRLRDDGILEARARPGSVSTIESAQEALVIMRELVGRAGRVPMLADLRPLVYQTPEAGRFVGSEQVASLITKLALVTATPVSDILAAGFVGLVRPPYPTRVFGEFEAALAWLAEDDEVTG